MPAVSPDNNAENHPVRFPRRHCSGWSILKVYEAALNRDEECLKDRGQGLRWDP